MNALPLITKHKLVAIIRGAHPGDVLKIAKALYAGGVRAVEITMNSADALTGIDMLTREMGEQLLIGAGTVLDPAMAEQAITAGAKFIISPNLNVETIHATRRLGAVSIPGAFTATEIVTAYQQGADLIKVFPASVGPAYLRDLHGPLPHIPLMPTGGITLENVEEYLGTGAVAVGVGSALVDTKQEINSDYLERLTAKSRAFVQLITPLS